MTPHELHPGALSRNGLLGWLALKEEYGRSRLVVSAAMLVGFYLVATAR
jgi:hypothetical protein